jgi:hypothetical protein
MRITPEARKAQLLDGLEQARNSILAEAGALLPQRQSEVFLGAWSAYDLVAHLIGWDFSNIQAAKDILDNQLPQFYAHHDRDWRTYNASLVQEFGKTNWDDLLVAVTDSHSQLMAFLQTIPAGEFDNDRGLRFRGWKVTIARLLEAEADDETTHAAQVAAFKVVGTAGNV